MDYCIYHRKDLDGLTSGAIIYAHQISFGEDCNLHPYDYGEKIDTRIFKGKATVMIDVSLEMDRMETLAQNAMEFIWIDHHISAYKKLIEYCTEKQYDVQENDYNALIKRIEVKKMNLIYFYSEKISAAEIAITLYAKNLLNNSRNIISLIGQYDTWRNSTEKKFSYDQSWDNKVLPIQYYMRTCKNPIEVYKKLKEFDDYTNNLSFDEAIEIGNHILKYQLNLNEANIQYRFEFEFEELKVVALNTTDFSSLSFKDYYHPDVHDAMLAFRFDGKRKQWIFSLYTTKDEVDILSIAKKYGGGGHSKACGFQLNPQLVHFFDDAAIMIGEKKILDVSNSIIQSSMIQSIDISRSNKFSKRGFKHFEKYDVDYMVPNVHISKFEKDSEDLPEMEFSVKYHNYIATEDDKVK